MRWVECALTFLLLAYSQPVAAADASSVATLLRSGGAANPPANTLDVPQSSNFREAVHAAALLANGSYYDTPPKGFKDVTKNFPTLPPSDSATGFQYRIYVADGAASKFIFAFRGSVGGPNIFANPVYGTESSVSNDTNVFSGAAYSPQFEKVAELVGAASKVPGLLSRDTIFVGHSLGGALAQYATYVATTGNVLTQGYSVTSVATPVASVANTTPVSVQTLVPLPPTRIMTPIAGIQAVTFNSEGIGGLAPGINSNVYNVRTTQYFGSGDLKWTGTQTGREFTISNGGFHDVAKIIDRMNYASTALPRALSANAKISCISSLAVSSSVGSSLCSPNTVRNYRSLYYQPSVNASGYKY